jgi:hypothetical protein
MIFMLEFNKVLVKTKKIFQWNLIESAAADAGIQFPSDPRVGGDGIPTLARRRYRGASDDIRCCEVRRLVFISLDETQRMRWDWK